MGIKDDFRAMGAKVSDGPIEQFREGWAIMPFIGGHGKPHNWRRIDISNRYIALCGLKGVLATAEQLRERGMPRAQSIKPLAEGDFRGDRCRLCQRKAVRRVPNFRLQTRTEHE
jgi:hypothetical protein